MTTRRLSRGLAVGISVFVVTSMLLASVAFAGVASAQSSQADVVFVFDETGSMDDQAEELQNEVATVASELDSSGIDARYALITYEDAADTEIDQPFTSDPGDIETALEDFSTFGGTENASHGILVALNDLEYRDDAQKIVVVITDEDDDAPQSARETAMQQLNDDEACLVSVSQAEADSFYDEEETLRYMAEEMADCGKWTDIESGFSTNVITDLVEFIQEETGDVSGPNFRVVDRSIEPGTVYTGETATVSVDVRNAGGSAGEYDALLIDRGATFRYDESVRIGAGETRTITIPVSYDEPGEYSLRFDYDYGLSLTVEERPPEDLNESDIEVRNGDTTDGESENATEEATEVTSIRRSTVASNETYEITAVVENTGNETGVASVAFASGDDGVNSTVEEAVRNVTLDPGETATVSYTATVDDAPSETVTRTWTVNGEPVGNVTILGTEELSTGLVDAYTEPATVAPGESYDVVGVLYNDDDVERPVAINFAREERTLGSLQFVTVAPGETVTVSRTVEAPADAEAGPVEWYVNDATTTVEVEP